MHEAAKNAKVLGGFPIVTLSWKAQQVRVLSAMPVSQDPSSNRLSCPAQCCRLPVVRSTVPT